jgi:hypothetical protein
MTYTYTDTETAKALRQGLPREFLVEIGETAFHIYGSVEAGWSLDQLDILQASPFRYATLDELMFALLNCALHADGSA